MERRTQSYLSTIEQNATDDIEEVEPEPFINMLFQWRIAQLSVLLGMDEEIPGYNPLLVPRIEDDLKEVQEQYCEWLEQNPEYKVRESE